MVKSCVLVLVCLTAIVQVALARDLAEAINSNIRDQLLGYQKFLEQDDGTHKEDLNKLINLSESALKSESADEKQKILNGLPQQFTPEFNKYISEKLEEFQVNDDITDSIQFYKSLENSNPKFKDEITKTVATLENILKIADLKQKEDSFLAVDKSFTPEFMAFLKENSLPNINRELQKMEEFFENLLADSNLKFENEIKELKEQTRVALGNISVEEKQQSLQRITNPENRDLYAYLQQRFVELN